MKVCLTSHEKQLCWITTQSMQCLLEKEETFAFCFWRHWCTYIALDCWNGEKVANRKHQKVLQSNYCKSTSKTQVHTGSTLVNHSHYKKFCPRLESVKYWQTPATEHLKWTWPHWYLHDSRLLHHSSPDTAAELGGRWQPLQMETVEENSTLAAAYSRSSPTVQTLLHYYFIFLAVFWSN